MTPLCNGACNQPQVPHTLHLFTDAGQLPLRVTRHEAVTWLPDGVILRRAAPDAIRALKHDVQVYLARVGVGS